MRFLICLLFLLGTTTSLAVRAVESVQVVGLFPGKVVVVADGDQFILRKGQLKKGIRFVDINGESVSLTVDGKTGIYKLGAPVSTIFASPSVTRKTIQSNQRGMFFTTGSINGQLIRFLVDTGATTVAMSSEQAKKLGIQYRLNGRETVASTASGTAKAYRIKLKTVKVGAILQRNIDALVINGAFPRNVLLGMSFLNRIKVEKQGGIMVLEAK